MKGNGHRIKDSIFRGGPWGIGIFHWSEAVRIYSWLTMDLYNVAIEMTPMFVDDDFNSFQVNGFADFDFTTQNLNIPLEGSSIMSVANLFNQ